MTKSIALIGNPNVGKSTLFNRLTSGSQKIGNWPGKTVEIKQGDCEFLGSKLKIIDLPGIYSLNPNSSDEHVANNYLDQKSPDVIIQIADSTNLERNLYLTTHLLQKKIPIILALNFNDISKAKNISIDEKKLRESLGIPVVKISAKTSEGLSDLLKLASAPPKRVSYSLFKNCSAKKKYYIISKISKYCISMPPNVGKTSQKIDNILMHKFLSIPIFLVIMFSIFQLSFTLASPITEALDSLFSSLASFSLQLAPHIPLPAWVFSLIADGVISGVGGILIFLPNILILFFLISILEDSGYFARIALITDPLMQKVGLEGKAFMPLMLGFGCNVPAIMSTRIINDEKERLISILINPLMSCSARLPIYVLFTAIFFREHQGLVMLSIYLTGILLSLLVAKFLRLIIKSTRAPSLLLELPPYRTPNLETITKNTVDKALIFVKKAGYLILSLSIFIWFLASMPFGVEYASEDSYIGQFGNFISPIFSPAGFDSWEAAIALLLGSFAKEVVVSTFATLYGAEGEALSEILAQNFTPLSAFSFMLFSLIYMPCIAALAAIKKETQSWRWTLFSLLYMLILAWLVSTAFFQIGTFLGF